MRLVITATVAVFAIAATAALAQEPSPPANTVGSGTSKALEPGPGHMVGKPVSPTTRQDNGVSQRRKATAMRPRPGSVPENGTEKPAGTTGAPPYGSSTPKPNSSSDANKPPYGG
jgi:hypothetical protein